MKKQGDKFLEAFREYNKTMKRCNCQELTLEQFTKKVNGKKRVRLKGAKRGLEASTYIRPSPTVPSGDGIGVASPKKHEKQYTGDQLLGIATMHKSNAVPVFKASDAEEIAKMRRG